MYGIAEAACLLGLRADRARAWLGGYAREGVSDAPVRLEHTGDEVVTRARPADEWLQVVCEHQLIVITRDQRIRYRPVEKLAWVTHHDRGFVLTGRGSQSTEQSLNVLTRHWSAMEARIAAEPGGPWRQAVTSHGLRPIELA